LPALSILPIENGFVGKLNFDDIISDFAPSKARLCWFLKCQWLKNYLHTFFKPRHMFSVAIEVAGRHTANIFSLLFHQMW